MLTGASECGKGATNPAPDVTGAWALSYADDLKVEITIGGAVYQETVGVQGGSVTINHDGQPFTFNLNCARPEVVCPSEVWAEQVSFNQKQPNFPRRVWVTIPQHSCDGELIDADPMECGADTANPDCEQVCDGETTTKNVETFGLMTEDGSQLNVFLGAGVASNGINCVALGISGASAEVVAEGSADSENWTATALANGEIATGYAGGCLWAGDPDDDGTLEAVVLSASITLRTSFTGTRK